MSTNFIKTFAEGLFSAFSFRNTDPIVDMFRIEYAKEYRNATRNGVRVDRAFVEAFLTNRCTSNNCNC